MSVHGGRLVAKALKSRGVSHLFTLSGGHLFSIYDGCKDEGIEIVDVRHEQTAAFAAEGFAKATRRVGVAALTAGPGVTNGVSAIAGAQANCSPRLRARRAGAGVALGLGLAAGDRPPALRRAAGQVGGDGEGDRADRGVAPRRRSIWRSPPPSGPTFVDYPLDVVFTEAEAEVPAAASAEPQPAAGVEEAVALLAARRAPRDHGRHRPLLGSGRGGAAGAGRGARNSGLPQRARPGLPRGRSRAGLQPGARGGLEGGRRGPGRRRADRLPAGLRRQLRRGDEADSARRRAQRADGQPRARGRPRRRHSRRRWRRSALRSAVR